MDKFKVWRRVSEAALRANFSLSDVTQFNNLKNYVEAMHYQRIKFNGQSSKIQSSGLVQWLEHDPAAGSDAILDK